MRGIIQKQGKSKRSQWTNAQRQFVNRAVSAGCILCGNDAAWHHCKEGWHGAGMRAPHQFGLPLCPKHHTMIHEDRETFIALAQESEAELVKRCQQIFSWEDSKG